MVHAPAGGGSSSTMTATASMRDTPYSSAATNGVAQSRMGRMGGTPSHNGPPNSILLKPLSAQKAQKLDLTSVERRGAPDMPRETSRSQRLFGLHEAPTFRPTEDEFRNPIEYIRSIAEQGKKFGIVKIIPPDGWNPDFAINTERFHFRTRRQELNIVEGGTRANLNYLDQLAKFHKQRNGTNLNRFPSVDKRPLDLYKLKKLVEAQGGFERVCKQKKWAEIGRLLGYSGKIMSSLSTSLKNSYQKWLLPFEEYLAQVRPGVQQQRELENGGPYTPSPSRSPTKPQMPFAHGTDSPTVRASNALHASVHHGSPHASHSRDQAAPKQAASTPVTQVVDPPRPSSGFTAVNSGFAPVSGFTSVNQAPAPPPTAAGALNGVKQSESHQGTPLRTLDSPMPSTNGTPNLGPSTMAPSPASGVQPFNPLKRPTSADLDGEVNGDSANGRRSKRIKKEGAPTVAGSHMTQPRLGAPKVAPRSANEKPGSRCETCGRPGDSVTLCICDGCDLGYHPFCLDPPLYTLPTGDWYCARCLVGNNDFGFEEGGTYSLRQFQTRAQAFKDSHFGPKMPFDPILNTKRAPSEHDVEREFWRLTESLTETVEVEYGADIHSHISGSGFPTLEKNPRNLYASDPWNLNNLPLDKESLFRHIKTDISGMTVPWLYVGMCFSCFCWHAEDHNTYSANYQHFGSTKTWYGVPAEDAEKLETAMREAVPDLFEANPDLLYQLTTLLTPDRLMKAGVKVYALDQRAGQFVITFPQAYHAGFNHGFNFNEAVNFAPSDWEPYGEEAVRKLRAFRRQPVFCHDELLLSAASRDHSVKTARWLGPALTRMLDDELRVRSDFAKAHKAVADHACPLDDPPAIDPRCDLAMQSYPDAAGDEDPVCAFCKAPCYLSRYVCKKSDKVICLEHAGHYECCDISPEDRLFAKDGQHVLQYRFSDEDLTDIVQKVVDTAKTPDLWQQKLDQLLDEGPSPPLKNLRTILAEGEKLNQQWHLPYLPDLRTFVDRCNEWVEKATNFTTRKQQNRRKNERAWRKQSTSKTTANDDEDISKGKDSMRSVEDIRHLIREAEDIGFDAPEIATLREKSDAISEFQKDAQYMLKVNVSAGIPEIAPLLEIGRSFSIDIPELDQLELLHKQLEWFEEGQQRLSSPSALGSLADVTSFIARGLAIQVPKTESLIITMEERKNLGEFWEGKAREIMEAENIHYQQLDALSTQAWDIPVNPETLAKVEQHLKKQRDAAQQIQNLVERSKQLDLRDRPTYKIVRETMEALGDMAGRPPGTLDLEREMKRHEDWMRRGKKLFGKANAPLHILLQHMQYVETRNEACFDLRDTPRMPVEPSSRANSPDGEEERPPGAEQEEGNRDVFCICRKPEAGMMIECELCHEWYHGKCLKIARGKIKEDDKYTCPICDYRVKIPRDAARPKLEDLLLWQSELPDLPFQPDEEETLNKIVAQAVDFRGHIAHLLNPMMSTPDEHSVQRFYLRKIEGADVLLVEETNFLRQELHRWAPVAPEAPPKIETSLSTRKPRPTKQQKMMKEMGIENPDDLPPHLRPKKQMNRKLTDPAMVPTIQTKPGTPHSLGHAPTLHQPSQLARSNTPPGEPPASVILSRGGAQQPTSWQGPRYRTSSASAQGGSLPPAAVRRESLSGASAGGNGMFNSPSTSANPGNAATTFAPHDEPSLFSTTSSSTAVAVAGGALDPSLFDAQPSTSPKQPGKGHLRNISDAGPAPSFGMDDAEDTEGPHSFFDSTMADMAGEALGLAAGDGNDEEDQQAQEQQERAAKDMADEFLA